MNRIKSGARYFFALAVALFGSVRFAAYGQEPQVIPFDVSKLKPALYGGQTLAYLDDKGAPTSPTKPCLESLPGNGTRAGYMLSHGAIVPSSVRVSVGARSLRSGTDYGLDYNSGMLVFTEPVRRFETITVSYEYVEAAANNRSLMPANGLTMNFKGTSLSFGYGVSSFNGLDFNTYGLSMTSKVGSSGNLKGMVYFSSPSAINQNVLGRTDASRAAPVRRNASAAKSDHLITQDLNATVGSASFRATYQDVGDSFGGFQAMRQAHANNAEAIAQIGILERERGIRRLGFGTSVGVTKDGKLGFDWDQTSDGKGKITRQQISLSGKSLSFTYSDMEIDRTFEGFQRLREGEAAQWARERGLRRTTTALSLTPGKGSSFAFEQGSLRDPSGALNRQSITLSGAGMSFTYSKRSVNSSFARLNDLSDAEKGELALEIRRQFNPNAQVAEVTPQERQQIAGEAGLDRSRMAFTSALGKDGNLAFQQFQVSDGNGSIRRQAFSLNLKGVPVFTYMDQSIDRRFGKLDSLNVFERAQYGNELGIRRTAMSALLPLGTASALAYNQSTIRDETGSMSRQTLAYTGKGVNAVLNVASTDSSFARARDLAGLNDAQRAEIEGERGFRRTDFAADVTAIRGMRLTTYTYNAFNATDDIAMNRFRHYAEWTPGRNSRITYLTEGHSRSQAGNLQNGQQHSLLTLDHNLGRGMKLNMFTDSVTTATGTQSTTVTTRFAHFETDRSKPNNVMAEIKRVSSTAGTFENTNILDLNLQASRNLALRLSHHAVDRGTDPSATTNTLALNWRVSSRLEFAGTYARTTTNNNTDAVTRALSLKGEPFRGVAVTASLAETAVQGRPMRSAAELTIGHAKPFTFLGMTNVNMGLKVSNLNDQGRRMSQAVSGLFSANVGRHQLGFEYGGSLDPKNQSAIARTITFVSDRNEKLPLHFDITYKARNINHGHLMLTRQYNLSFRMDRNTQLQYTYASLPDGPNGQILPTVSSNFTLRRTLGTSSSLAFAYTTAEDFSKKTLARKLGINYQTQMRNMAAVQVGYSVDISNLNGQKTNAHTISLSYDRRVSNDNVLAFGAAYTMNRTSQPDDIRGTVEFRTRF